MMRTRTGTSCASRNGSWRSSSAAHVEPLASTRGCHIKGPPSGAIKTIREPKPSSPPPATGTSNRCRTSSRAAPRFSFRRTPADARHRGPAGPAAPSLHAQRPGHRNTAARFTASASTWSSRCSPTRVQPASGSIPTPRQSRRTDRMAAHHGDPQPVEALAAHHRAAVRLRERARRPPPPARRRSTRAGQRPGGNALDISRQPHAKQER